MTEQQLNKLIIELQKHNRTNLEEMERMRQCVAVVGNDLRNSVLEMKQTRIAIQQERENAQKAKTQ